MANSQFFKNKIHHYSKELNSLKRKVSILTITRLLSFLLIPISLYFLLKFNELFLGILCSIGFASIFIYAVIKHSKLLKKIDYISNYIQTCKNELSCMNMDYSNNYNGKDYYIDNHDYLNDLNIIGDNSIFQYISRAQSELGQKLVANWLSNNELNINTLKLRQSAIKELSKLPDFLLKNICYAKELIKFPEFGGEQRKTILKPTVLIILSILSFTLLFLAIFSIISWKLYSMYFIFQLLLGFSFNKIIDKRNSELNRLTKSINNSLKYIENINNENFESELLNRTKEDLISKDKSSLEAFKKLNIISELWDYRLNLIVGTILNGLVLWDLWIDYKLSNWINNNSIYIKQWQNSVNIFDALSGPSLITFYRKDLSFPFFLDKFEFEFKNIGHLLIDPNKNVKNSIDINKESKSIILTGANMAGKSTFLRSLGSNLVLGMAGFPICGESLAFKPICLFTSMSTTDSLNKGESYFHAELLRIRKLYDKLEANKPIFYLLDEILKGTNSLDKLNGSKKILNRLIEFEAFGIVATHDLELGKLELNDSKFNNYCFEIEINKNDIKFDYKLKRGISNNMNALALMKIYNLI